MSSSTVNVALLQIQPREDQDRRDFVNSVADQVRAIDQADIIVLPELWQVGYFSFDAYGTEAEPTDGPMATQFAELAREVGSILHIGSFLESDGSSKDVYNTSLVFGPDGAQLASYRKMHVFGYQSRERELIAGGKELAKFSVGSAEAALTICYDLRFPELFRAQADEVSIYFVPATWPAARLDHWRLLLRARAVENQAYVVGCNAAGSNRGVELGGHSAVVAPSGDLVVEADGAPTVLHATLNLGSVSDLRSSFPALDDRVWDRRNLP